MTKKFWYFTFGVQHHGKHSAAQILKGVISSEGDFFPVCSTEKRIPSGAVIHFWSPISEADYKQLEVLLEKTERPGSEL